MGKLYLSDTLKLILSDKVNVPDNEIDKLSGTFYKLGLSDNDEIYGILFMIYSIAVTKSQLPMSMGNFRSVWHRCGGISLDFVSTLATFVKSGILKIKKRNKSTVLDMLTTEEIDDTSSVVIFVEGTDLFNECVSLMSNVLETYGSPVFEGVIQNEVPSFVKSYVKRLYDVLDDLHVYTELESFSDESNTRRVNLNINNTSKYDINGSEIEKLAKSFIKNRESRVVDVECYKDTNKTLFLGIDFKQGTKDFNFSCASIFSFIEELELNHVK
jgi:hypothetical protein